MTKYQAVKAPRSTREGIFKSEKSNIKK